VTWIAGRAAVQKEAPGIRVAAAFEQQDGDQLEIRVEVQNLREEKVELEPAQFTFTACHDGETLASCRPTERIVNPEAALAAIDTQSSREKADNVNNQVLNGTLLFLSVIGDVKTHRAGGTLAAANAINAEEIRHDTRQASLATQRQVWSNVALRRHTLLPGMAVSGDVFIPIDLDAKVVWLHVRGDGWKVAFPFYQRVTKVY
jgi:hypothetical protein